MRMPKDIATFAAVTVGGAAVIAYALLPGANGVKCDLDIKQVQEGSVSYQRYLDESLECMPELRLARSEGALMGIVSNPNFTDLSSKVQWAAADRSFDDLLILKSAADQSIDIALRNQILDHHNYATTFPAPDQIIGMHFSQYIVMNRDSLEVTTDSEARAIQVHEAWHTKDAFSGVLLTSTPMNSRTINQQYSYQFATAILEIRAYKAEIDYVTRVINERGDSAFSQGYLYLMASNYSTFYGFLKSIESNGSDLSMNPYEKEFWNAQQASMKNLTVTVAKDSAQITNSIGRKQVTINAIPNAVMAQ